MSTLRVAAGQTFRSLRVRNYRLYFVGMLVSTCGTWMQSVAQSWLVLKISGSSAAVGLTVALQFLPVLLGGAWSGVLADRIDKRRLLVATQTAAGVLAGVLGFIVLFNVVQLWHIFLLAFALGVVTALDNPARRALSVEMVGKEHVANAVSLSSAMFTGARVIGPAIAGLLIAGVGIAWCFFANAISYIAAIIAFIMMRSEDFYAGERIPRKKGQLREGLHYVWRTPELRVPLLMVAVIGTLSYNFQVVLPALAKFTFGGSASTFGLMYSLMSIGSVLGALFVAHRTYATRHLLIVSAAAMGALMLVAAAAPSLALENLVLVLVGASSIMFVSTANGLLQQKAESQMQGRVMALYSVAFLGSTPIGGPIVGWVDDVFDPRAGLALGGLAALATALAVIVTLRARSDRGERAEQEGVPVAAL
ncbi:MAG: MFS transporter [Actinobacteria bacterium]|nr:MFS transporter [Actinomycetota bacterium]